MDLPSKSMYDTFKDEIWKELAPLDPNWFEVLTAQTSVNEGNGSDQDDLCANQEGHFKTPFDKAAGDSQLFSTPKIFRRSQILSPETEDEQSFTAAPEKETSSCAATQSPCLFPVSKERVPGKKCGDAHRKTEDGFDLLHTPSESPVSYAKHISESLGAQINPDISWTSSLNTPPAIPSTLILSQTDEKPCPPSVTPDRKFIFVRKLFPSLSKGSSGGAPENDDTPAVFQGAVSTEAPDRPQGLIPSECVWQQKVPDAIKDGDVRSTIAGILDGAEDVLSVLFANSSSSLRKVKPERLKWKPIVQKKRSDTISTDALTTHKTATGEEKAASQEPSRLPSSPLLKTGHSAISQWSPLSLMEIPPCNEDNNILTEQLHRDADPSPLARPSGSITHSGFIKKKRQYVYTIGNLKSQDQGKEPAFQKMDSLPGIPNSCESGFLPGQELSVNHLEKAPPEADCCSTRKMEVQKLSVEANVQDLDISQLSRDFAQDFSQMSDGVQQSKVAKDAQHIFSPSACLSAMKQAKQKVRQANLHHDCDGNSNGRHISTFKQNCPISEGTISDSGFQSAAANITRLTATPFDPQPSGFKTDIPATTPFPSTKRGNGKMCIAEAGTTHLSEQRSNEKQTLELRGERESHPNNTSAQQPSQPPGTDNINRTPSNGQYHDVLPEKMAVSVPSTHTSGFKTASNKGIHISSNNLERAKRIFEETEGIQTCLNQSTTRDHATKHKSSLSRSVKITSSNSSQPPSSKTLGNFSSHLTASQTADVTDLCSFLEEAESQFEFTQSKTAKIPQHCRNDAASPQKAEKELDSDLLAGINFDDSFSSDAEKHREVNAKPDRMASVLDDGANIGMSNTTSQSMKMPLSRAPMRENSPVPLCLETTTGERCPTPAEPKDLHSTEHGEVSKSEDSNTPVLGVGFKTAGGNVLKVSKKSLSKARALFVDFEKNLTGEKSPDKQNRETDAETKLECSMASNARKADLAFTLSENKGNQDCLNKQAKTVGNNHAQSLRISNGDTTLYQSGFQKASGKQISISANYLEKADAFFRDCVGMDSNGGGSDKSVKHGNIENKKIRSKFTNLKVNIAEGPADGCTKFETGNAVLVAHNTKAPQVDEVGSNITRALKNAATFHGNPFPTSKPSSSMLCTTSKDIDSSGSGGFCTASGNKISVSADALKRAEALLKDGHTPEDIKRKPNPKENASNSEQLKTHVSQPKSGEFQTASGKEVSISLAALRKAQTLLNECNGLDKIGLSLPHHKIPVTGPLQCNSGFSAASGKPVAFSSEALQKAKALFSDISPSAHSPAVSGARRPEEKHEAAPGDVEKVHCGLTTASGADVHVRKNLLKAKQEFDDLLLTNAMQEEDAFFKDFDMDADDAMLAEVQKNEASEASHRHGGSKKKNPPALDCTQRVTVNISKDTGNGFVDDTDEQPKSGSQTGSGKVVSLLSGTLSRASNEASHSMLNLCEEVEDKMGATPPSKAAALPFSTGGFRAASGKPVAVSSEALLKAKSLFIDIGLDAEKPGVALKTEGDGKRGRDGSTGKIHCGFTTAGGAKVRVSRKSLLKAKHLLNEYDGSASANTTQEADALLKDGSLKTNSEMSEKCKSGMDCVKGDLSKLNPHARVMSHYPEEPENGCSRREVIPPQQPGGFQTASGNAVAVSHEALKRAKTLLSDCEEVLPPHSKLPGTGSVFKSGGFFSASGKPAVVSSEALQKAERLFGGVSLSTDTPGVSDARRSDKKREEAQTNREKMHSGFTTAAGGKVLVSEKSLLNAKNVLKEFSEEGCHSSSSSATSGGTHASDLSTGKAVKRLLDSNVARHCDRDVHAERRTSPAVEPFPSLQQTPHANKTAESSNIPGCSLIQNGAQCSSTFKFQDEFLTSDALNPRDIPEQEVSRVLERNINQTNRRNAPEVTKTDTSSVLNLQSLNLSGCTVTQQRFLAQEALDCTKALLEDEDAAGQSLSPAVGNMPLQVNSHTSSSGTGDERGRRKRVMGEPDHIVGQPPSKRRLLEEFDKTVDGSRGSVLHPVKSCPIGLMKDRAVFKYSDSLHPNITKPHSDGKNYAISVFQKTTLARCSVPGDSRLAPFKTPAFVPPLDKSAKRETGKDPALKDNARVPTFVPPFKKQKTVVQESFSKQHKVENQHHQPLIEQPKSSTYVPPAQKTKVDTATNANMTNNQSVPVNCASVSSGAEASYVDVTSPKSQEMHQNLENIELARDMQDMRIRKKKRQTIRPLPGTLFLTKTSGVTRVPLKVAVNGSPPGRYTPEQLYAYGVHKHVPEITSETAESFRFSLLQFIKLEAFLNEGGVKLADGGWLVPSNDWTAGKEEFYRALCDTPGVDPKLITEAWVHNHYRWVVWKLASMEKSFPETMGSICLTPEQVLLQLKYRYDVEVDHSRRSALKKIMEKDDTAAKTLVLCVSEIISRGHPQNRWSNKAAKTPQTSDAKVESPSAVVWLTDGWYAIKAQLDEPLSAMLQKGLLAIGGKLIIHGAQLVGSQDACSPLEAPESLMLKIYANSSRLARWDAKLGFQRDPRPFLLPVSSFYSTGGPVGCVDVIVLRSYPVQWMERKPDGGVVFRSARAEEKEARRYNSHKQKAMEMLFAKIQAEFEKEEEGRIEPQRKRRSVSIQDIASLEDGQELHEAVGDDPAYLQAHLSEQQLETLRNYRLSVMEKKQAELSDRYRRALEEEDNEKNCPKRDVTPVWRLSIADSMAHPICVYQLNLWRPSSDLQSFLKEGCRYKVYNLVTSEGKKRSSAETVQFTGTKKTQFQELQASQEWLSARFQPRVSTNFVNLQNPDFHPPCEEVDLTGVVISVIDGQGCSPAFYLADEKWNFVKVRCFSSLSQVCLEDVVKPRVLLAVSNLQLRGQSINPTPVVYAGDLTVVSSNPKEVHLQESLSRLKNMVQCLENFYRNAEEKLSDLVKLEAFSLSSPAQKPQTPASATDKSQDPKTSVTSQKPMKDLGSFTPVIKNPSAATPSAEKDPRILKRRRALDYLSRIPSPPPLSHLGSVASPCMNKTFNPPRRSGTPSTLKTVQTPAQKPTEARVEDELVNDEELAMIDTQALLV